MTDISQGMTSENINELATALAKAQTQVETAVKDKKNSLYNTKYADLGVVWMACREALNSNGLSVCQTTEVRELGSVLVTRLIHSSGQWIKGEILLVVTKAKEKMNDMQALGSAITFARRYGLAAIVGVCTEDDDGNSSGSVNKSSERASASPLTSVNLSAIRFMLDDLGDPNNMMHILTVERVRSLEEVPDSSFTKIMKWLETKKPREAPPIITCREIVESGGDEMTAEERAGVFL